MDQMIGQIVVGERVFQLVPYDMFDMGGNEILEPGTETSNWFMAHAATIALGWENAMFVFTDRSNPDAPTDAAHMVHANGQWRRYWNSPEDEFRAKALRVHRVRLVQ